VIKSVGCLERTASARAGDAADGRGGVAARAEVAPGSGRDARAASWLAHALPHTMPTAPSTVVSVLGLLLGANLGKAGR